MWNLEKGIGLLANGSGQGKEGETQGGQSVARSKQQSPERPLAEGHQLREPDRDNP